MKALWGAVLIFLTLGLQAQVYQLDNSADLPDDLQNDIRQLLATPNSAQAPSMATDLKNLLYRQGYYLAEIKSRFAADTIRLTIDPGPRLYQERFQLSYDQNILIPPPRQSLYQPLNFEEESNYYLNFLENHGYPFAEIKLDRYSLKKDTLRGLWLIEPGPLRRFDSLVIKGFDRFSPSVLKYDLAYRRGMLYSESYLNSLPARVEGVEYLQSQRAPAVAFTRSKSILYLYLQERKGNQVDGVLGLNTDENGKVSLNGDFQLRLLHAFKSGEEIKLRWRRPDESVQSLNLLVEVPYLFRSPLWWRNQLEIFRQDSSFVNFAIQSDLKYLLSSRKFLTGGIEYKGSSALEGAEGINELSTFNALFYRLGLELSQSDRLLLPQRGYELRAAVGRGDRQTGGSSINQYDYRLQSAAYFNPWTRHVFKIGLNSSALFSPDYLSNEVYRIGGLRSLRGFNEQSIYSSAYGIATLEYRFSIGNYDYLGLFSDIAYTENRVAPYRQSWLTGLGAGINFETGGGIFSLFFAVGKSDDTNFDLRTTKVHFGYVNQF